MGPSFPGLVLVCGIGQVDGVPILFWVQSFGFGLRV